MFTKKLLALSIGMSTSALFFFFLFTFIEMLSVPVCVYSQVEKEKEVNKFMSSDSSKINEVVYKQGKGFLAYDKEGNELFEIFPFDNGPDYPSEGLFRIIENKKIGYADEMGNIVIKPQFDAALPLKNGMAAFCEGCIEKIEGEHKIWEGGKWGFINRSGEIVIPAMYDRVIEQFEKGIAKVEYEGSVVLIDIKGSRVKPDNLKYNSWIDLLGRSAQLIAKLFFGNNIRVDLSWQSNDKFIFSSKENTGYYKIIISRGGNSMLLEYDIIPWQDFGIAGELDSLGNLTTFYKLITVTDYAVTYAVVNPAGFTKQYKETIEEFHKILEEAIEKEKNNQLQEEELNLPDNVRVISNKVYNNYVDLQIALPGSMLPQDSVWKKICKGRMLYLQIVPDVGEIKKRWVKTIDSREDPYYTSVEDGLLKCFADALDEAYNSPASRNKMFEKTKLEMRELFSAANSYVNFLYDKYEERLKRWLFIKEAVSIYPTIENIFGDYQPKRTPDTILDYMPSLSEEVEKIPNADLQNYSALFHLLKFYQEGAKREPGHWEDGNMILGANPREYRPSKNELLASEVGDRLAQIINDNPKEKIVESFEREKLNPVDVEYTRFTFTHADVMGSGRFFYVHTSEKIKLSPGKTE